METTEKKSNSNVNKIVIIVLALIIAVLTWQLIVTKTKVNTFTIEKEKALNKNVILQHELDSLVTEHEKIKKEFRTISGQLAKKDSIILAKAGEIQRLISVQADYFRIKKQLNDLRTIAEGYVTQIDSLSKMNKVLTTENIEIKGKYQKEQAKTTQLTKDKDSLSEKVSLASTLKAYNIKGVPIKTKSGGKKEEVEEKARKTDRIKVSFTLSENLIARSGSKTIYVRIARPDDKILCVSAGDANSFPYNGEKMQYSIKKDIDYQNKAIDLLLYWDKTDDFIAGTYVVSVYTDGYLIGESQFMLK